MGLAMRPTIKQRRIADHLQVRLGLSSVPDDLTGMNHNNWNGKDRRSGGDRRQSERRDSQQRPDSGVLSTRKSERRQAPRRKTDRNNPDTKKTNDE